MERISQVIAANPVASVVAAALAGSCALQLFNQQASGADAAKPQGQQGSARKQLNLGKTKHDESFDFVSWADSLPSKISKDMQELLAALDGEVPNLHDLHLINDSMLKGLGVKPLARARILSSIDTLSAMNPSANLQLPKIDTQGNAPLSTSVLSSKQDLDDVKSWEGKRVLIRVDYNVPIKDGKVTDPTRITETIPTIERILNSNGKPRCIVLICHLGRPAGNFNREKNSLRPCLEVLRERMPEVNVEFVDDCVGPLVHEAIANCKPGTVLLCENLRFHPEEAGEDVDKEGKTFKLPREQIAKFEDQLSTLGDIFVFEAFGVSHRKAASVTGIKIPQRVAGLLMQKELQFYSRVFSSPQRPFLAIVGGAKVSDKIQVIENLLNQCDELIIGGGMAYTFKKVLEGVRIGSSIFDKDGADVVGRIMRIAKEKGVQVHLPVDHIIADSFSEKAKYGVTTDEMGIPDGWMALDVGPVTRSNNKEVIMRAKTILWNGPLGVFELGPFAGGTLSAMWYMAQAHAEKGTVTVIGGGDTGAASQKFFHGDKPMSDYMSHVSTGGGSSLVLMEGKMLPAVPALSDKAN